MSALAQCPRCGREITAVAPDGMVTCTCGYRGYLGYLQEAAYLAGRQQWLQERIANGEVPPAEPLATQYGIWKVATPAPATAPRGGSTQLLLISLGALLLLLAGLVFVAVAWELIGPVGRWFALLLVTLLVTSVTIATRGRTPRTAEALAVVAFGLAAITLVAAPALDVVPQEWTKARYPYWLIVTCALVAFGIGLGRWFGLRAWTWLGWLTTPFVVATVLGLVLTRLGNDEVDMTVAAATFLAAATALLASGSLPQRLAGVIALMPAVGLTLGLLTQRPPAGAILVIAAALLILLLVPEDGWREWVGWPLFGFWLALLAMMVPDSALVSGVVAIAGGGLLFALVRKPPIALLSALAVWLPWLAYRPDDATLVLALAAVALYAAAFYARPAAPLAWLGAGFAEVALLLQWSSPPIFEGPTLALAALFLLAGLLQWRAGTHNSAIVLAPAVSVALIPSALASWFEPWSQPSLIRFLVVMTAGLVLLLIGVRGHILGLVVPSAIAIGITAVAQLFATLDLLPRWLALAIVGAALIVAGARLEWLRDRRRDTQEWLESLQ